MMKRLTLILMGVLLLVLSGCPGQGAIPDKKTPGPSANAGENTPGPSADFSAPGWEPAGADTDGFQKEMNVQHPFRLSAACETELGYYLVYDVLLYFLDGATGNVTAVCARPECGHTDDTCNAWIHSRMLSYYQGKLYYVSSDAESGGMSALYRVDPDGANHTKIQRLQLEAAHSWTVATTQLLTNGRLYFLDSDSKIYTVRLGEDVSKAVPLWEDDMSRKLESDWKFWTDGGEVYAMNHMLDAAGNYQDVLYRLGENQLETRAVWRSAELGTANQMDPSASWYITGGHLYYYFSGNDLWDVELETGRAEKLISLAGTLKSGTALFTDSNIIFLDDQPDSNWPGQSFFREGGRKITVYDYGGKLLREVGLDAIYEQYADAVHCAPVFADGSCVYLLVSRGMDNSASTAFYRLDWEQGSLSEAANWPGADFQYDGTQSGETQLAPIRGEASSVSNETSGAVTLSSGERELKAEGTLRGEIEAAHKLPVGKTALAGGVTVRFHAETKPAGTEFQITLTGVRTGAVLEGRVTGPGDLYFEIDAADEYSITLENCSISAARFTLDYSIGGSP